MRIAIVGGTGFVGSHVVDALLENGHRPVLLVRPGSEQKVERPEECDIVHGSVDSTADLMELLRNCNGAIYLVGILREQPRQGITFESLQYDGAVRFIDAAVESGIKRFLLMSANGVKIPGTAYQETKLRAEQYAMATNMAVTVFRPSVIFGDPRGRMEFATQLANDMVAPPIPAVGFFSASGEQRGRIRMSPVHIGDVADAFAAALDDPSTVGEVITLVGKETLTWGQMLRRVAAALDRNKWVVPMPIELMKLAAAVLDWVPAFPVTRDQLTMLAEGNTGNSDALRRLLGREPLGFEAANLGYLQS